MWARFPNSGHSPYVVGGGGLAPWVPVNYFWLTSRTDTQSWKEPVLEYRCSPRFLQILLGEVKGWQSNDSPSSTARGVPAGACQENFLSSSEGLAYSHFSACLASRERLAAWRHAPGSHNCAWSPQGTGAGEGTGPLLQEEVAPDSLLDWTGGQLDGSTGMQHPGLLSCSSRHFSKWIERYIGSLALENQEASSANSKLG